MVVIRRMYQARFQEQADADQGDDDGDKGYHDKTGDEGQDDEGDAGADVAEPEPSAA